MSNKIYFPGDRWLYVRIYTGFRTADEILREVLHPVWHELLQEGLSHSWFFVRYADPDFHLRYRIHLAESASTGHALALLGEKLHTYIENGLVWKVELGSYQPEYDRYGVNAVELSESLFHYDSEAFMNYLNLPAACSAVEERWQYGIMSVRQWLDDFGLSLPAKKEFLLALSRSFGLEFGKDAGMASQLSAKYRMHRSRIQEIMEDRNSHEAGRVLEERSERSRDTIAKILEMHSSGKLGVPLDDYLGSILHMSLNRIFQTNNRLYEMVLYDFLFRICKSRLARSIAEGHQLASTTSGILSGSKSPLLKLP